MHASLDHDDPQLALARAFADGLQHQFGELIGGLLADVVRYCPRGPLDRTTVARRLEADSAGVLNAVVTNQVHSGTLRLIGDNTVGCAILRDLPGVIRWATEGRNQSARAGNGWEQTGPRWQFILEKPDQYIRYVHAVKTFMNQV